VSKISLRLSVLVSAGVLLPMLVAGAAEALQNNGGGAYKPGQDPCYLRYQACLRRCIRDNPKDGGVGCEERTCFPQYVGCINTPDVSRTPGTTSVPGKLK